MIVRWKLKDDSWITNEKLIQGEVLRHFASLFFSIDDISIPFPIIDDHPKLDEFQANSLLRPVDNGEVYAAVKSMKPYKAPGLDAFQ